MQCEKVTLDSWATDIDSGRASSPFQALDMSA